jgi:hypothetical protein
MRGSTVLGTLQLFLKLKEAIFLLVKFSAITPAIAVLALATLGSVTQIGLFLFVLLGQGK